MLHSSLALIDAGFRTQAKISSLIANYLLNNMLFVNTGEDKQAYATERKTIKRVLKGAGCEDAEWIQLARYTVKLRAAVNTNKPYVLVRNFLD